MMSHGESGEPAHDSGDPAPLPAFRDPTTGLRGDLFVLRVMTDMRAKADRRGRSPYTTASAVFSEVLKRCRATLPFPRRVILRVLPERWWSAKHTNDPGYPTRTGAVVVALSGLQPLIEHGLVRKVALRPGDEERLILCREPGEHTPEAGGPNGTELGPVNTEGPHEGSPGGVAMSAMPGTAGPADSVAGLGLGRTLPALGD